MGGAVQRWEKLGLVFAPSGDRPWLRSHASLPTALHLAGDRYRVYFASRDERNRSHVAFVELELGDPAGTVELSERPVLEPGPLGFFDDHGVYPASLVQADGRLLLYYVGWNPSATAPVFYSSIGLAVSDDGGLTFSRLSRAPILGRDEHDPCLVTSPCVVLDDTSWHMWYVSGIRWEQAGNEVHSYYEVKHAASDDGVSWRREDRAAIPLAGGERNIARPSVLRAADRWRMWYSRNSGNGYRLGYAESRDGERWQRLDDEVDLPPSPSGWDSAAIAYPHVFVHGGRTYMLYNGNRFGRDGFGLAIERL
jgi:predicted GH43/DUF377 family glycosyl hydrolase